MSSRAHTSDRLGVSASLDISFTASLHLCVIAYNLPLTNTSALIKVRV